MKKVLMCLALLAISFLLVSCKSNSEKIRSDFNGAGANLPKDHLYISVSFSGLKNKLAKDAENGDDENPVYTIVFYGNPSDTTSVSNITGINQAAIIVNNDESNNITITEIYYIKSSKSVGSKLNTEYKVITRITPTIWIFKNGTEEIIDGSASKYRDNSNQPKVNGVSTDYVTWARHLFQLMQ